MCRTILIDPLVDPADALIMITPNRTKIVSADHWLKSALAKPVVVIIDETLKNA